MIKVRCMLNKNLIVLFLFFFIIVGCNRPENQATNENFTRIINEHLKEKYILIPTDPDFPVTVEVSESGKVFNKSKLLKFDALVAAKLLKVEDVSIERLKFGSPVGEIIKIPAKRYSMTPLGEENFYMHVKEGTLEESGFKVGYYQVDKISSFTKPVERMYYVVTQVYYECSPKEISEWAINSRIIESLPFLSDLVENKQKRMDVLVQTADGWVHKSKTGLYW